VSKITHIVGIDEVGRGPLAGPVTLCACAALHGFDMDNLKGIKDSKKLTEAKREEWFAKISGWRSDGALDFAHFSVSATDIDAFGISKAIQKSIAECLEALNLPHETTQIFLDGSLKAPAKFVLQETIIKGDEKIPIISAASIIAKVNRDRYMEEQGKLYPAYGFEKHKGYGTSVHIAAIKKHGTSPLHRKSFLKNIIGA
jgi:ribonuclease HII